MASKGASEDVLIPARFIATTLHFLMTFVAYFNQVIKPHKENEL
jgi:hypothetical protein